MAELRDIRAALADSIRGTFQGQVSPYMLSNPTPPTAHIFPDEEEPHQGFGRPGIETWNLILEAFVDMVDDIGSQDLLDSYLASTGALSLLQAIEADQSLGGTAASVTVSRISGYRQYQLSGTEGLTLGAQWTVAVLVG